MKPPLASVPPSFWPRTTARKIRLGPLVDRRFVLALAGALAAMGFFLFFADAAVLPAKNTLPVWLVDFSRLITRLGDGGFLLWPSGILIIVLLALQRLKLDHIAHATIASLAVRPALVFSAVAIPGLISALAKGLIGRTRPKFLHGQGTLNFDPFAWDAAAESFPSGHTTIAFASAVVLGTLFPRYRIPFFVLATLVGVSRILLREHYPSDTIGGAMFGIVFACLVVGAFSARRLSLAVTLGGAIKPKAMPRIGRLAALAASILATLRGRVPARPYAQSGEIFERN
jgi:membrane-associated phospholipid phosphatase